MTTAASLVEATKRHLLVGSREARNKLSAGVDATTATIPLQYALGAVQAAARISVDLEDMHVWSASGQNATVERGQYGSTAATHSSGAIVFVNPSYSPNEIFAAINDELDALSAEGLYRIRTVAPFNYSPTTYGYDLTAVTDLLDIYDVAWSSPFGSQWVPVARARLDRDLPTSSFPSGKALFIEDGSIIPGRALQVTYKAPFTRLAALADNVETVSGIPATAVDILPLGAAIRLSAGRPVRRSDTTSQGDTRRAAEVTTGDTLNAPAALRQLRAVRVGQEVGRLNQQYPMHRRRTTV